MQTLLLAFDTVENAKIFVRKLHIAFDKDISTFRDDVHVMVFDATPNGAARRIYELSRRSSATSFKAVRI